MKRDAFEQSVASAREEGESHLIVPVHRRLNADMLTPVSAFHLLRDGAVRPFLLESVEGGEKLARYSFLGRDPYLSVRADGSNTGNEKGSETVLERPDRPDERRSETIFDMLGEILDEYKELPIPDLPRFTCGAVGYLSYDVVRFLERLPGPPPSDVDLPEGIWCFYDTTAAFDHVKHQLVLVAGAFINPETNLSEAYDDAVRRLDALESIFSRPIPGAVSGTSRLRDANRDTRDIESDFPEDAFKEAVDIARNHIREGDIFQVVLSRRFSTPFDGDAFELYRSLRQVNPSPYLFFLEFEDFALVGSSPEVLVRVEGRHAELLPIAGTRPRGDTPDEDVRLADELLADPKERAEHLMLVDLGRNDLGRISTTGSVSVDRYAYIERYSHVMHIVSSVSGRLRDGFGPVDVLSACFPAGTVSGAPKVRAMEIIDDLEPTRRGPYAGSVGYLDFRGNLDTCITIRTMLVHGGRVFTQAGAGIVAESNPDSEVQETLNKARALHQAIRMTGR